MKTPFAAFVFILASAATLPAAVSISVSNYAPNGSASGGTGSGVGAFNTTLGSGATDRGMPVTTYTISNVDFTSLGGGASESFTFTVSYTATTDGSTAGTSQFNGFGNVSVTGGLSNDQVEGTETITATILLTSSTFADLSLTGFTSVRAGGVSGTETGTFTYAGGTQGITATLRERPVTGNWVTLSVNSGQMNFEGFTAEFVAVPEPGAASLLGLGALALLRRRRSV